MSALMLAVSGLGQESGQCTHAVDAVPSAAPYVGILNAHPIAGVDVSLEETADGRLSVAIRGLDS